MEEIAKVRSLLEKPLQEKGYEIADIRLSRDRSGLVLSIVVDRVEPISLDDIVKVSELINPLLDKEDPIEEAYTLDVSSLGAEKPIDPKQVDKYIGKYINIHLLHPYQGKNILEGTLLEASENSLTLETKEKTRRIKIEIERKNVDKARLAIEF